MTSDERRQLIGHLAALPQLLETTINGLDDQKLDTPYRDGGWTVRQVIHHLADSHMNAFVRMKLIVAENHPTLKTYNQDDWAVMADSVLMPAAPSLDIIRGLHARWTAFLSSLNEEHFARTAHHPERGTLTLDSLLTIYAHHGEKHCKQIAGLRERKGW